MSEPTPTKQDYGALNRQELRKDLEQYDFVTPSGEPLAPLLDSLMKDELDPKSVASVCEGIEAKQFECQGGPLRNSDPWIELRRRVGAPVAYQPQ
jgi:hypothetical protein